MASLEAFYLSPNGDRLLLSARGELWSVPVEPGVALPVTLQTGARERWASYSPDGDRVVYLTDAGSSECSYFDEVLRKLPHPTTGQPIGTFFGVTGSAPGEFAGLTDVAVDDRRGWLYAVDTPNSRIQQFRLSATSPASLTLTYERSIGTYGSGLGQLAYPQYVAVDQESGRWYVSDMGNERIQAFSADGTPLFAFAPPEIARWQVLGLNLGPDGAIYAADAFNNTIWVFAPDGSLRSRIAVAK